MQPNPVTVCTAVGFGGLLRYAEAVPSTHGLKHTYPTTSLQGGASSVLQIPDSSSVRGVTFKAVQLKVCTQASTDYEKHQQAELNGRKAKCEPSNRHRMIKLSHGWRHSSTQY